MPKDSIIDPEDAAISAGLTYVNDDMPGITRQRSGKGFSFMGIRHPQSRGFARCIILARSQP